LVVIKTAQHILNFGIKWTQAVSFTSQLL